LRLPIPRSASRADRDRQNVCCEYAIGIVYDEEEPLRFAASSLILASLLLFGAGPVAEQEDIRSHPTCPICGMDRQQYAYSRMLIDYKEGPAGTCSIHCTAADIAVNRHKTVRSIFVADYGRIQLIPATTAFWVVGGNRSGVMTQRAKWAFENQADAKAFIKAHGGRLASFDDAIKATFEDMYADIKAARGRAQERKARSER
jgi:nitrous oxide reductase accessory protein NosL